MEQEHLGHASISEMLDRFSHATKDVQHGALAQIDAIFDKAKEGEAAGTG